MSSPLVSVVMSVFNGDAFLSDAIESILAQTFTNFEFVIIDDGSTDNTPAILSTYAKRDDRLRVFSHLNRGRAESLNRGIEISRGRYIARMDADDVSLPDRLEGQVSFLEQHPKAGLVGGAYEQVDSSGRVVGVVRGPREDAEIRVAMRRSNPMCHPAILMRRDAAISAGGYRKVMLDADDYDLWLRIIERWDVANLDKVVLRYRIHASQASVTNMRHQMWCVFAAREAAFERQRGKPDPISGVVEITREFVVSLGITDAEIDQTLVDAHRYWIAILRPSCPDSALNLIGSLTQLTAADRLGRPALANLWLDAAAIHYRLRRYWGAALCAGHAVVIRPCIAGRPVKRAMAYVTAKFQRPRRRQLSA